MADGLIEHTIMTNLRREYEAQGYDFYENPPPAAVPSFLGKFQPDAIAVRGDEGVVVELKPRSAGPDVLKHIAERFEGQNRWRFRVFFYDVQQEAESSPSETVEFAPLRSRIVTLRDNGEVDGALLLAWATLEAVVRAKSSSSSPRGPSTPYQIVERLEHLGVVGGEKANLLRQAAAVRNAVAHGRFDLKPGTGLIDVLLEVADTLNKRKSTLPER